MGLSGVPQLPSRARCVPCPVPPEKETGLCAPVHHLRGVGKCGVWSGEAEGTGWGAASLHPAGAWQFLDLLFSAGMLLLSLLGSPGPSSLPLWEMPRRSGRSTQVLGTHLGLCEGCHHTCSGLRVSGPTPTRPVLGPSGCLPPRYVPCLLCKSNKAPGRGWVCAASTRGQNSWQACEGGSARLACGTRSGLWPSSSGACTLSVLRRWHRRLCQSSDWHGNLPRQDIDHRQME